MNDRSPAEVVFFAALEKATPAERAAYLDEACAGQETLRHRVEDLLTAHAQVGQFLERPVVEAAGVAALAGGESAAEDLSFLAPSSEPGSLGRLDHYEVLEVIGRGGTGVVLRARDTKLLRVVALKVLAAPLVASGTARLRFAREARAAAAVRDEHVVAIHAVRDDAPVPYLVMEYIDGCNLETLIRKGGPLEVKEVLRIGMQIARGLAAAHQQGLIHRDVKPANILLENGVQRVKLGDFGLARAADDATLTQTGFIAGTPLYMAPEQAAGEPIDARADLFSLGSVLYELCSGRPAFRALTTLAVIKRVCEESPRPIREVNPDTPECVCRVIERLHAKNPADRPASATEVADLLAGLLVDLSAPRTQRSGVSGRRSVNSAALRARRGRRRWFWVAAALVLLLAGLSLSEATGVTDMRGTVIRLFAPEGALVVEVDDPGVRVTVDGGDVVITGAGAKEIRLRPGQYSLQASKDGKLVRQELVTVTRNGRQVVRISKEAEPGRHAAKVPDPREKSVAEKQVAAVVRRLKELNLRFNGEVKPTVQNGVVTGLQFLSDEVNDISPVRMLEGLRTLDCRGSGPGKGKLADLTPLRGLQLTILYCWNTQVADLNPLRGMPLTNLGCRVTRVSDLAPLKGMRLITLDLNDTEVADLTPLRGMPLDALDLHGARKISDLRPLEGMPVEYLNLCYLPVSDLSVLASLKRLRHLVLTSVPVADLTPLRGLPLDILGIQDTRVTDLTPLKGKHIIELFFDYRPDHENILRSLPWLKTINGKPTAKFRKEVSGK